MSEVRYNHVTFRPDHASGVRLALKLEGPWVMSCTEGGGVSPNVNRAIVPWTEFAQLTPDTSRVGTIEFWFRNPAGYTVPGPSAEGSQPPADQAGEPDHQIKSVRLVDVEIVDPLERAPDGAMAAEYRLFFADVRERYVFPRGGRLNFGLINADPLPLDERILDCQELIWRALDKMGILGGLNIAPEAAAEVPPPRDLRWFGAHAPTELAALLERTGCVLCPRNDGTFQVMQIGAASMDAPPVAWGQEWQDLPTPPQDAPEDTALRDMVLPDIDRRSKTVVITSAPTAAVETSDPEVSDLATNYLWVINEADCFPGPTARNRWLPLSLKEATDAIQKTVKELMGDDSAAQFINEFWQKQRAEYYEVVRDELAARLANIKDVLADPAETVRKKWDTLPGITYQQIYRCAWLLNFDRFQHVLRQVTLTDKGGRTIYKNLTAKARCAVQQADGTWKNSAEFVPVGIVAIYDGGVIQFDRLLGRVKSGGTDLIKDFEPLRDGDLQVTYTAEAVKDGKPEYFNCGWRREGEDLVELTDEEVDVALRGQDHDDVVILSEPSLRLVRLNGEEQNRETLKTQARQIAQRVLAGSGAGRRYITWKGFWPAELSGLVGEIRWDQDNLTTTLCVNTWWSPVAKGQAEATRKILKDQRDDAATSARRTALGEAGHVQPAVPVRVVPGGGGSGGAGLLRLRVRTVGDDVLICRTWDGTTEGTTDVIVAKPWDLQKTPWHGKTVNAIAYTFTSAVQRNAVGNGQSETQAVVPPYFDGCEIIGITFATGVTYNGSAVMILDMNQAARAWARKAGT